MMRRNLAAPTPASSLEDVLDAVVQRAVERALLKHQQLATTDGPGKLLLTLAEARELCGGLGRDEGFRLYKSGIWRGFLCGRRVVVTRASVLEYIEKRLKEAEGED